MALWVDGIPSTIDDLRTFETTILETASAEGIDLRSKLQVAHDEITDELRRFLAETSAGEGIASVWSIAQVVQTKELKCWHTMRSIELTYRDAFHQHLTDRYKAIWQEYVRLAQIAGHKIFYDGIGIVRVPVRKASLPSVTERAGVMVPGTYQIQITWQNKMNQEGVPSEPLLYVSTGGAVPELDAGSPVSNAIGWNVYIGVPGGILMKQNVEPIGCGELWTAPVNGFVAGPALGAGQEPELLLRKHHTILRG